MTRRTVDSIAQEMKEEIVRRRGEITAARRPETSGLDLCMALTGVVDHAVRIAYETVAERSRPGVAGQVAVMALGGYGRVELCPHSDVDIMILCDDASEKQTLGDFAGAFLHLLWDAGLDAGHSVRRLEEVHALHGGAPDIWASLLESRFLCGEASLATRLQSAVSPGSGAPSDRWFLECLLADSSLRHERYGHSVKLLEPNVKKSAGGLRDFQSLLWLFRATDPAMPPAWNPTQPAARFLLRHLRESGQVEETDANAAEAAVAFLLRTRHQMHALRRSLHDTLEHALQREVAEGLGYGPAADPASAEAFMRTYYRHARVIYRLHVRFVSALRDRLHPPPRAHHEGEKVGSLFALHEDRLTIDPSVVRFQVAGEVLEAFVHAAEREVEPDSRLCRLLEQGLGLFTGETRSSPELAGQFHRILLSRRVGATLQSMNDLGVLGAYLPEFGDLKAFYQHSVYHYYTADEHTLIALIRAEQLREQEGILHDVFQSLRRKDVLYLAILLHDVGKPRGVADHEITGAAMTEEVLRRLGMEEALPAVTFLVRHHLLMEQTAFRRNIHDSTTAREFAALVGSHELLDALYLLTYADLSAVNSSVWTTWKASLLRELYLRASGLVRGVDEDFDAADRARYDEKVRQLEEYLGSLHPREDVRRHLAGISNRPYVSLFSDEEISRHIEAGKSADPLTTLITDRDGYSEVTVVARDAPFLLSRCCAVLSANDANIFDATVMTREDGVIFDRFRVTGVGTGRTLDRAVQEKIASDMQQVLAGSLDIGQLFQAHRRRWRRRARAAASGKHDVRLEEGGAYTIIDVYAADSVGLLYRLTDAISRCGLDIHFAKIATRGDGVADAFYVRDREGRSVDDPTLCQRVRSDLLEVLAAVASEELS